MTPAPRRTAVVAALLLAAMLTAAPAAAQPDTGETAAGNAAEAVEAAPPAAPRAGNSTTHRQSRAGAARTAVTPGPAAALPAASVPLTPKGPKVTAKPSPAPSAPTVPPKANARTVAAPNPTATVATPYGSLGKWMLNSKNQIADWVGLPYQGRTLLEGINVVIVDSASRTPTQASGNLNAWMRRSGFGPSAFSSTGYQGIIGSATFGQKPTGANTAYRDAYFLFANSHGRVFGPFPNPNGPGYVWTAALSEENLDVANFSHGHESFNQARTKLVSGMVGAGAQSLGQVFMDNVYNTPEYTTGDADGYAAVIGINGVLKQATPPRGGATGTAKR